MAINLFNSQECEWADMSVIFAGAQLGKIRSLEYGVQQDKEHLYAAGDEPISIQSGNRKYTGTVKILKGALDDINRAAITAAGRDILDMEFDIAVTYKPSAAGIRPLQNDTLIRCQITEFKKSWEQGAKHMEITLPIIFLGLKTA